MPVIGMTMDFQDGKYRLNESYVQAVIEAGGVPICIPYVNEEGMNRMIQMIDGFLLTGGGDLNPLFFGEEPQPKLGRVVTERDENEILWAKKAIQQKLPILAICRGLQILNVALGGTLYQDIYSQHKGKPLLHTQTAERHEPSHYVYVKENSKLSKILNTSKFLVNSFHHQAIKDVARDLEMVGKASDGIIEAIEHRTLEFCIGVQWHPEELAVKGEACSVNLFKAFITASAKGKNSHSHC